MTLMGRPIHPLRQFVLKVHSRCDLACDHCYVFEHADQSWRGRPTTTSDETLRATAERIAEHATAHHLDTVHVVLHGGEPLLAGRVRLRRAAQELTAALAGVCALDLRIHTNAVTLDERFLDLFAEYDIKVGVSLDGDKAANDLHRRYANGRSSHNKVLKGIALLNLPRYRHLFAGILCTIDVRNDPVAVYSALAELTPPRVDFLLPHATWDEPPLRPADDTDGSAYARWLLAVYDRWTVDGRPMDVRVFDSVLNTLHGGDSLTESLGLAPSDLAVIETDGTYEQADSLKTAYDGAPVTGMDVRKNSIDEVAVHPGVVARQQGLEGLCEECRNCPVVRSCGGGLYAHRYSSRARGFVNPSAYCSDLLRLITGIQQRDISDRADEPGPLRLAQPPLADHHLDELASGPGSATTVELLARQQLALHRELLARVWQKSAHSDIGETAWRILTLLDRETPESVDRVLAHPYLRPWAIRSLQGSPEAMTTAMRGVAEVAAAAALRAGRTESLVVPVKDGVLWLPTHGALKVRADAGEATVRTHSEGFTVQAADETYRVYWKDDKAPAWQASWWIELDGWAVSLSDTDPWRDGDGRPPYPRLTKTEAESWQADLSAAWDWIRRQLPQYGPTLAVALRAITPLASPSSDDGSSTAVRDAFGAVAIARPNTPEALALFLVRECRYVWLGAVLDQTDLCDPSCDHMFYAPWASGPGSLESLLGGAYARLAVLDFWQARLRTGTGAETRSAETEFTRCREQISEAMRTLTESNALTSGGQRFVAKMREAVQAHRPVPHP